MLVNWIEYKYTETPPFDAERNRGGPKCCAATFGDPVDATTGNKFETRTEFVAAGAFPLRIEWTYNASGTSAALGAQDLIFGRNRSHFYGRRLANVAMTDGVTKTLVARPDGKSITFYKGGVVGWTVDDDVPARLTLVTYPVGPSEYRLDDGFGGIEFYGMDGRLQRLLNMDGQEQRLFYGSDGRLDRVVDRQGRTLTFEYVDGRVSQVHQPDGKAITFDYDANGDLSVVRYPDGGRTEYRYDELGYSAAPANSGLLTAVIHDGQRYSSTKYDSRRMAISTYLGDGVDRYDFVYSGTGPVPTQFEVMLPSGAKKYGPVVVKQGNAMPSYVYTRPCPNGCNAPWTYFAYAENGYFDTANVGGVITDYDYNNRGLLVQKIESANQAATKRTEQTTWHATLPIPLERRTLDATGTLVARTTWTYNERGQELTSTQHDPVSGLTRTTTRSYCEQPAVDAALCQLVGLVLTIDGPRTDVADVTTFQYYDADNPDCAMSPITCPWRKGDLWKMTNASGQVSETLAYDGAGRVTSIKDGNGVTTALEYDAQGRLTSRTTRGSN